MTGDLMTKLDHFDELEFVEKVALVRGAYTPRDLCEQFEIEVIGDKVRSPFNEFDQTPSCHLYEDGWFDYSTGKWGDVIDLAAHLSGRKAGTVMRQLAVGIQSMELDPDRVQRATKQVSDLTELFRDLTVRTDGEAGRWAARISGVGDRYLGELFHDYLAEDAGGNLLIPHWHDGRVLGIKVRSTSGGKTSVSGSSYTAGLYTMSGSSYTAAVIVEGESDSWALDSYLRDRSRAAGAAWDVYALPSGAGLWRDDWLAQLERYETVYTAFDNDRAGENATVKVRSSIGWGRWKGLVVPTLYNDVREALHAGWKPNL